MVNDKTNPKHYQYLDKEVIDMMLAIWGKQAVKNYCEITAFKYRMREGRKPNETPKDDYKKENWFINKAKELG